MSSTRLDEAGIRQGARFLARRDPALHRWIDRIGPISIPPRSSHFRTLVRAILSQQVSSKAADAVLKRVLALFSSTRYPSPAELLHLDIETLRSAGVSRQKAGYLHDLAAAFADGHLRSFRFDRASDERVTQDLVRIKGINRWTTEMFLIFALRRPDVFFPGDLALRAGLARLENRELSLDECVQRCEPWRPWRSVGCLYLWKIAHWSTGPSQGS